jgi:transposase
VSRVVKQVKLAWPAGGAGPIGAQTGRKQTSKNQPQGPWRQELQRVFGADLTAIPGIKVLTGLTLLTELGPDLSAFPSAQHFASWLCLCPDNGTSASKVLRRRTRRSQQRVRQALRMAACALHHDKSYLGDKYRRLRAKLGARLLRPWPTSWLGSFGIC